MTKSNHVHDKSEPIKRNFFPGISLRIMMAVGLTKSDINHYYEITLIWGNFNCDVGDPEKQAKT